MLTINRRWKMRLLYLYKPLLVLLAFFFGLSGFLEITKSSLTYPKTISMGYPPYFIFSLGVAKISGALVLLLPFTGRLKEWVFAGFIFDVIFAFISGAVINSKTDCVKALIAFCIVLFTCFLHELSGKTSTVPAPQSD